MKTVLTSIATGSLLAALAIAEPPRPSYNITDLGVYTPAGGAFPGGGLFIANDGFISGTAVTPDGSRSNAVLWYKEREFDIGTRGLGGPNSAGYGVNEFGQAVGQAESSAPDGGDDFCGFNTFGLFPTLNPCLPFLWQNGVMISLPTLGGANGWASGINDRGDVAGLAENAMQDTDCPVHQFKPVVWKNGRIQELPTHHSDHYGVAAAINDKGQVVGATGACASFNANSGYYLVENHAVLWENGEVTDLGNFGGNGGPAGNAGNHACAINNRSQVVGHSELGDSLDSPYHAFLWTRERGKMLDLGTLPGDFASAAIGINDRGEVVGLSVGPSPNYNSRAILWENGVMTDLNTLIAGNPSGLYLAIAVSINVGGEIVGVAGASDGSIHSFLATPSR